MNLKDRYELPCALYGDFTEDHCLHCIRRNLSLLNEMGEDDLTKLNHNRRILFFNKGESIFKQGQRPAGLFALSGGKVKNIHLSETGDMHLVSLNKPVEFLGFSDLINDAPHRCSAVAIENCSVCYIPIQDFIQVLKSNNLLMMKSLQYVSNQYNAFLVRTSNLTGKNMRGRMAYVLMYLFDYFDVEKKGNLLQIDLRRSDFGNLAQMNTANAIRVLSDFSKNKLIEFTEDGLQFLQISALRQISLKE